MLTTKPQKNLDYTFLEVKKAFQENNKPIIIDCINYINTIATIIVRQHKGSNDNINEIRQEVSMAFYEKCIFSNDLIDNIGAYLRRMIYNKIMDTFRNKQPISLRDNVKWKLWQETEIVLEKEENKKLIKEILNSIQQPCQTNLINVILYDWSHQEIAEHLGIKEDTARQQYARCKKKFRKIVLEGPRFASLREESIIQKFLNKATK